jgi:hypothetical protein
MIESHLVACQPGLDRRIPKLAGSGRGYGGHYATDQRSRGPRWVIRVTSIMARMSALLLKSDIRQNQSHSTSNRVSATATRILKIGDQRLAREIGLLQPKIQKSTPQRLHDISLTRENVARIFATRTWPTETGLAGWGGRTRTQKCRRKISL